MNKTTIPNFILNSNLLKFSLSLVCSWSQPNPVIRVPWSAGFWLHQCELHKRSFRQQCLHCVSRSLASHCQRFLASGGGNRGPGHCHGVQRTRRWQAQMRTILEWRNRCRMSIRKILCQASQITRNMPRFSRYILHLHLSNRILLPLSNCSRNRSEILLQNQEKLGERHFHPYLKHKWGWYWSHKNNLECKKGKYFIRLLKLREICPNFLGTYCTYI